MVIPEYECSYHNAMNTKKSSFDSLSSSVQGLKLASVCLYRSDGLILVLFPEVKAKGGLRNGHLKI